MKTQKQMFYEASHNVAMQMLSKQLMLLTDKRTQAVQAWRDGGKTDALWADVEAIDKQMEPLEQTLSGQF